MTFDNVNTINCITNGKTQLLGVPQMVSGTGENQAAAVSAVTRMESIRQSSWDGL